MKDGLQRKKKSIYLSFNTTKVLCRIICIPQDLAVSCCQNPLTTNILCMSQPVFKYYSLIRLSRLQNMCRLHTCFYLSVISIQNVLDCKLSQKILNSCSIGIHTVLHCVSDKFVRRHSDKWRVWEVKMCVQVWLKFISLRVAYWWPWRMTFIRYIHCIHNHQLVDFEDRI